MMIANSKTCRRIAALLGFFALVSCGRSDGAPREHLGTSAQAFTDTDADSMDDAWEATYFGSLSRDGTGDFDSDGMTDAEEYAHWFDPTVDDAFQDADGDRYPNVFEVRGGSDPNNLSSTPSPTFTVDANGGGTHTTISAARNDTSLASGDFAIIAIAPGVYSGSSNNYHVIGTDKPKTLFIGSPCVSVVAG